MSRPPPTLQSLPTEIKVLIGSFTRADPPPPAIPQDPPLPILASDPSRTPLKSLSLVSREWRALLRDEVLSRVQLMVWSTEGGAPNATMITRLRTALKAAAARLVNDAPWAGCLRVASLLVAITPFQNPYEERNAARHSIDVLTICGFWRDVLSRVDPLRLALFAQAGALGWMNTNVVLLHDMWAFPGMSFQMMELERQTWLQEDKQLSSQADGTNTTWDTRYLFCARPWTALRLYEGSALEAYSNYEYFHKTPPTNVGVFMFALSETMTTFSDHLLFPFNDHLGSRRLTFLSAWRHIHLHYSPSPNQQVLDDPKVVGKADLSDCWRELEQLYSNIVSFDPPSPLFEQDSSVREFSTGDYAVSSIREILDSEFAKHAATGWRAAGEGRWILTRPAEP